MSITIYPSQFNMREDGSYAQLPAIKGETGERGVPGVGALPGGVAGQVPVKQSADDYDVAWEDIGWTKVWENASPTSDFAAQAISEELSKYSAVIIEYANATSLDVYYQDIVCVGKSARLTHIPGSSTYSINHRQIDVSSSGLDVKRGITGNNTTSNDKCIPTRVWGR